MRRGFSVKASSLLFLLLCSAVLVLALGMYPRLPEFMPSRVDILTPGDIPRTLGTLLHAAFPVCLVVSYFALPRRSSTLNHVYDHHRNLYDLPFLLVTGFAGLGGVLSEYFALSGLYISGPEYLEPLFYLLIAYSILFVSRPWLAALWDRTAPQPRHGWHETTSTACYWLLGSLFLGLFLRQVDGVLGFIAAALPASFVFLYLTKIFELTSSTNPAAPVSRVRSTVALRGDAKAGSRPSRR